MNGRTRWARQENRVQGLVLLRRRVRFHFTDRLRPRWVLSLSQYTYTWHVFRLLGAARAGRRFTGPG